MRRWLWVLALGLLWPPHAAAAECGASVWRAYHDTKLRRFPDSDAYFYATQHMEIDADGAPNAYHPQDKGLDAIANAGFPNGGWKGVLVADPSEPSRPFVQPDGEFAGYFVAKTSLQDKTRSETDPARYVGADGSLHRLSRCVYGALGNRRVRRSCHGPALVGRKAKPSSHRRWRATGGATWRSVDCSRRKSRRS